MMVLFVDGGSAAGLCCFGIHAGAVILWASSIAVDEVVCFLIPLVEELGCWGRIFVDGVWLLGCVTLAYMPAQRHRGQHPSLLMQ